MLELRALRRSVRATQKQMAYQMAMSLREYRSLEQCRRLDIDDLRSATFAALRIAIARDGNTSARHITLFKAFDELLCLFEGTGRARTVH
jgi:hypothetical protein